MGIRIVVVVLVGLVAGAANAQCARVSSCWCTAESAETVRTQSVEADGGATVERSDGGVAHFAQLSGEVVGTNSLVFGSQRSTIDGEGMVVCEQFQTKMSAAAVQSAINSGSCDASLSAAGLSQPPCKDNGCSIGVTPFVALLLVPLLVGFARRRRPSM